MLIIQQALIVVSYILKGEEGLILSMNELTMWWGNQTCKNFSFKNLCWLIVEVYIPWENFEAILMWYPHLENAWMVDKEKKKKITESIELSARTWNAFKVITIMCWYKCNWKRFLWKIIYAYCILALSTFCYLEIKVGCWHTIRL